ncbi:MAG: ABC transporter permease [Alphaproteobacteria bacterium]|uniref:Transport permease protein n=1 Tax=Candidatus Nitrobium versatile TaxID=2884831 RepID=A0A953JF65_9BACT|nr:ABC transporter permease [Candidatus Nitrobium versatile]
MNAELNAVYVVIAREFMKFTREKGRLISTLSRPVIWLFLVGGGMSRVVAPDMGIPYMQFIFPGIIGMTILFSSIFSSVSILWDKEFGFMKEMLVAPVSRFSIVVGKALSGTLLSTIQALIILLLFPFIGLKLGAAQIFFILCISLILSFCISALGILIASFFENFESFNIIINFIVMPMFFLSGAMYPVSLLPPVLRLFTSVNPLTYGIDALKYMVFPERKMLTQDFPLGMDLSVIIVTSLIFVIIAGYVFERRK